MTILGILYWYVKVCLRLKTKYDQTHTKPYPIATRQWYNHVSPIIEQTIKQI